MSKKVEFSNTVQTYGSTSSADSYYPNAIPNGSSISSEESSASSSLYLPSTSTIGVPTFTTQASPSKEYGSYYGNGYDFYAEGNDDDDSTEKLYVNENFGIPRYPNPTTLYRSNSVSIVNCEYKLKERFPHFVYLTVFVTLYVALILLGTSLFVLFEANAELRIRDQILLVQKQFLDKNLCVEESDLEHFVRAVLDANEKGVSLALLNELSKNNLLKQKEQIKNSSDEADTTKDAPYKTQDKEDKDKTKDEDNKENDEDFFRQLIRYGNNRKDGDKPPSSSASSSSSSSSQQVQIVSRPPNIDVPTGLLNWEFMSSLTYVTTLVTTIGYGHVTPITQEGKILTIVFGVIAIPSTLLFFSIIISTIRDGPVKWIEIMLIKFCARYYHLNLLKIRFIHLILVTLMLLSLLIILPALLFFKLEPEWTYLDAFYYCFITITTVGLGDFVPAQSVHNENRTYYLLGTVAYMYIGLCMIMLWIALVLRIPHFNFKTFLVIEEPEIEEKKMYDERTHLLQNEVTP